MTFKPGNPESDSIYNQGLLWVNGLSKHNNLRDECTPDFSCCVDGRFEIDKAKRIRQHNQWCAEHNYPIYPETP